MQDAADHAAIIHAILAAYVRRQMRLDPSPLLVVQPKQVASHGQSTARRLNLRKHLQEISIRITEEQRAMSKDLVSGQ